MRLTSVCSAASSLLWFVQVLPSPPVLASSDFIMHFLASLHQSGTKFLLFELIRELVKVLVAQSCLTLCDPIVCPWNSLGKNTGVVSHSLLQGMFLIQGWTWGLLHCRQIFHCLNWGIKGDSAK